MRLIHGLAVLAVAVPAGCFSPDEDDGGSVTIDDTSGSSDGTVSSTSPTDPDATASQTEASVTATDTSVTATDPDATVTATDPDTSGTEEGPPVDCDAPDGEPDDVCPQSAPFCQGGTCVGCDAIGDTACAALDPTTPICTADGACAACTEHDQCATGACRLRTGECFPEANRLWVDNTSANCANGTGAEDNPFCQITTAVEIIDDQVGTDPWAVFVAGSPNDYTGTIDPDSGRPIAIIGPDAGLAATLDGGMTYALDLWAQSPETYISHLTMTAGGGSTVVRGGGDCEVWFTDAALSFGGLGMETLGCTVHANRSVFEGFASYAVEVGSNGSLDAFATDFRDGSGGLLVQGNARLDSSWVRESASSSRGQDACTPGPPATPCASRPTAKA